MTKKTKENQAECTDQNCGCVSRRNFISTSALTAAFSTVIPSQVAGATETKDDNATQKRLFEILDDTNWPQFKQYPQTHVQQIALPIGGIGTGTVSLGGRGELRDWEIMNRPAKEFTPSRGEIFPFFAIYTETANGEKDTRILEGPVPLNQYEGSHGSTVPNDNLPRFRYGSFATAYPFGEVALTDPDIPVDVKIKGFNPFFPADAEGSGLPIAVLRYELINQTDQPVKASVCGNIPNFVGMDGWEKARDWKGDYYPVGAKGNVNEFQETAGLKGILMSSNGVDPKQEQYGTIALSTPANQDITYRLDWPNKGWGATILDFWDDYSVDGTLESREISGHDMPIASVAVSVEVPANGSVEIPFYITWHFPNRMSWTRRGGDQADEDNIGNYYTTKYENAWDAAVQCVPQLDGLEQETIVFVKQFLGSDLPDEVKEAALFNLSTIKSQTCFRTPDGRFYGFEGCCNSQGCCWGSCTHVWNYEQAVAFLFGDLAKTMREVEFAHATADDGVMSFRVSLPLSRARDFNKAAADGQMGCIMKMYRDWQLSGDSEMLKQLWSSVKKALSFCWIEGGWDADQDGVMEGCQHNTMDVEYYGPNPQMGIWYLGALRAAEEMAKYLNDHEFAETCARLYRNGSQWLDENLFNGEYYIHKIQTPENASQIAESLRIGMGSDDVVNPEYQLGEGCLVDQLVGQFLAHVCGLGYLLKEANIKKTLQSIMKYNHLDSMEDHFNSMRTFALGKESALLMASYPKSRPENPFSYFTEVMTGFEYTAAVGMLYEGMLDDGLHCIRDIRQRYDGLKRNPYNEAECGHHYARAMASWAAVLALTGFQYSAIDQSMSFADKSGNHFWSNGYGWGTCNIKQDGEKKSVTLNCHKGEVRLNQFELKNHNIIKFEQEELLKAGESLQITV